MDSEVEVKEKESSIGDLYTYEKKAAAPDIVYVLTFAGVCLIINCGNTCNSGKHPEANLKDVNAEYLEHNPLQQTNYSKPDIFPISGSLVQLLDRHKFEEWRILPLKCEPRHLAEAALDQFHVKLFSVKKELLSEFFQKSKTNGRIGMAQQHKETAKLLDVIKEESKIVQPYRQINLGSYVYGCDKTTLSLEEKLDRSQKALRNEVNKVKNLTHELKEKFKKIADLESQLKDSRRELSETLEELGRVHFENDRKVMKKERHDMFKKTFKAHEPFHELSQADEASTSAASMGAEAPVNVEVDGTVSVVEETPLNDVVQATSVQESREESNSREGISLTHVPSTAVERSIYNNYKLLLLMISRNMLLSSDIMKLQEWARHIFRVNPAPDVHEVFLELDRKGVISASNMKRLREFFEKYQKIDVVHLIDCFLQGDYTYLQRSISSRKNNNPSSNYTRTTVPVATVVVPVAATSAVPIATSAVPVATATVPVTTSAVPVVATPVSKPRRSPMFGLFGGDRNAGNSGSSQRVKVEESFSGNQAEARNFSLKSRPIVSVYRTENSRRTSAKEVGPAGLVVTDGPTGIKYGTRSAAASSVPIKTNSEQLRSQPSTTRHIEYHNGGSNGQKLSKFQRPDSTAKIRNPSPQDSDDDDVDEEDWLCGHYKRRCHVKFACCDKFWPCHRCHNNESNCGQKKLKSIHTKFVKCVKCKTEQEFNENSQFCVNCQIKFAKYFCPTCKHLTGNDDKPYHCVKCGICRIHKHRSFHCDVCGVCLDVKLRDNHKCRAGSAHDECCICLEDAFSGCQILPCSHKVHKECASQMIRNRITRCPICRESFAHKLEKRPAHPQ